MKKPKDQKSQIKGLLFIGPMFAGMGLGFIFGNIPAGLFIGMGIGFAFQALYMINERDKRLAQEPLPEEEFDDELDNSYDPFPEIRSQYREDDERREGERG
jgi:hypothetical protein